MFNVCFSILKNKMIQTGHDELVIWLYAYYHISSADNLPGLQSLQMDDLRELKGYKRRQLISVWDDPVRKVSPEQDLTAGELVGRIEETDADGDFEDWDATVLPEGTKIYETDDAQIMLAECEGEFVPYLKYVEG